MAASFHNSARNHYPSHTTFVKILHVLYNMQNLMFSISKYTPQPHHVLCLFKVKPRKTVVKDVAKKVGGRKSYRWNKIQLVQLDSTGIFNSYGLRHCNRVINPLSSFRTFQGPTIMMIIILTTKCGFFQASKDVGDPAGIFMGERE